MIRPTLHKPDIFSPVFRPHWKPDQLVILRSPPPRPPLSESFLANWICRNVLGENCLPIFSFPGPRSRTSYRREIRSSAARRPNTSLPCRQHLKKNCWEDHDNTWKKNLLGESWQHWQTQLVPFSLSIQCVCVGGGGAAESKSHSFIPETFWFWNSWLLKNRTKLSSLEW